MIGINIEFPDYREEKLDISINNDEINKKKQILEKISTEIWSVIEVTKDVQEIIWSVYKWDDILTRNAEILWKNLFKIEFIFPEYKITKDTSTHVSIVQMQLAIVQWLFLSIGLYIKQNGDNSPLNFETFLRNRANAIYRRDERTMRKMLNFNEKYYLIFKIQPIIKKWTNLYSITTEVTKDKETFLDGNIECLLHDRYIFDERKKASYEEIQKNEQTITNEQFFTRTKNDDIKQILTSPEELNNG